VSACTFTQKELVRLAVLQLEHAGRLLSESVLVDGPARDKLIVDADLLSRAAVAVVALPSVTDQPAIGERYHGG
jgi:hypothetical protein